MTSARRNPRWAALAGVTIFMMLASAMVLPAQTFKTLHSFDYTDGAGPGAALVQGADGNLYGTTVDGGASDEGAVFKITPSGTLAALYSFCSERNCTDGATPYAGLVQATDGNFYGTTGYGGANNSGTVFRITPSGALTTLYNFCSVINCLDGSGGSALVQGIHGDFYGTTYGGGPNREGTVFKVSPGGKLTTLHYFCLETGCPDGSNPSAALVQGADGKFYGTTTYGGIDGDYGTVFKITPGGTLTTLHSFDASEGGEPIAPLVQGADGNFYGTISGGGIRPYGTVFKITTSGVLTTLYSFCSQKDCADGTGPAAGLIQATDGDFYGTTYRGGTNGDGTIFKITPRGALTSLHSFDSAEGVGPDAELVQDTNGKFYGTTANGGVGVCGDGCGTVFALSVGLGPFVETAPTSGKAGTAIRILGTNLSGAISVTFNGTAATFKVVSGSLISTTVPGGATSGKVEVTTPGGTLSSNVVFRVMP